MVRRINAMPGMRCVNPMGAFYIMMDIQNIKGRQIDDIVINSSDDFCTQLLQKSRIALVPGSGFGTDDYVRLSFTASLENIEKGMNRLEEFIWRYIK